VETAHDANTTLLKAVSTRQMETHTSCWNRLFLIAALSCNTF